MSETITTATAELSSVVPVFAQGRPAPVAFIRLNGYNIAAQEMQTGPLGALRSFKMVDGELHSAWETGERLRLILDGQEAQARVAALPVQEESSGLIEFLSAWEAIIELPPPAPLLKPTPAPATSGSRLSHWLKSLAK